MKRKADLQINTLLYCFFIFTRAMFSVVIGRVIVIRTIQRSSESLEGSYRGYVGTQQFLDRDLVYTLNGFSMHTS